MLKSGKGRGWRGLNTGSYTAPTPAAAAIASVTIDDTTPEVGQTLTATANGVTGYPSPSASYQWKRGATNIGTNSPLYTTVSGDIGSTLTCTGTVTNSGGSASATSSATSAVVDPNVVPPTLSAPVLTWTSPQTDDTPEFTVDLTAPLVGDIITIQLATDTGFTTAVQNFPDTVDSSEQAANAVNPGITAQANGTYYARAKHSRGGTDSAWSNTVTVTIAPAFSALLNFRDTAGFVTDGAGQTYVLPGDAYPTTRNGLTFGWLDAPAGGLNRQAGNDPRLAGCHYNFQGTPQRFRLDLPSTGNYSVDLGMGDDAGQTTAAVIRDNTTDKVTINGGSMTAFHFRDINNTDFATAAAWVSGHTPQVVAFSTTTLILGVSGSAGVISHLSVAS